MLNIEKTAELKKFVEETPCPQCKWHFLTKKTDKEGNVTLICVNKECGCKS